MTDNDLPFALPPGFVIDKYRIERVLGYGGFSVVYEAAHTRLTNRRVAIKEYLPQNWFTRDGATMRVRPLSEYGADYEAGLRRFLDEANHLADIDHPNVIDCLDYLEGNGTAYLVMNHESGLSLNELLRMREGRGEPFDEEDIMKIVMPALDGLATAHDRDVLHRDLKPDNIFVRRADGRC